MMGVIGKDMEEHIKKTTSPLKLINERNIDRLGLAWYYDLPISMGTGVAAPLAVDGVLFLLLVIVSCMLWMQ